MCRGLFLQPRHNFTARDKRAMKCDPIQRRSFPATVLIAVPKVLIEVFGHASLLGPRLGCGSDASLAGTVGS